MKDSLSLKNITLDENKLISIGFIKENNYYKYETKIINDEFLLVIKIDNDYIITSDCIEIESNDKFLPYYVVDGSGEFIGSIRSEYEMVVKNIIDKCSDSDLFNNRYAKSICDYVKKKYGDELEFLWKDKGNAVFRNKTNNKWYGAILTAKNFFVDSNNIGPILLLDIRINPEELNKICDNKKYFRGYHMNKKSWLTIKLDGSVDAEETYNYIDKSYELSLKSN